MHLENKCILRMSVKSRINTLRKPDIKPSQYALQCMTHKLKHLDEGLGKIYIIKNQIIYSYKKELQGK